jgi:hypothetical protein
MYVCKERCYHKGRLWREGEIAEEWQVNTDCKHFQPLGKAVKNAEDVALNKNYHEMIKAAGMTEAEANAHTKDATTIQQRIAIIKKVISQKLREAEK